MPPDSARRMRSARSSGPASDRVLAASIRARGPSTRSRCSSHPASAASKAPRGPAGTASSEREGASCGASKALPRDTVASDSPCHQIAASRNSSPASVAALPRARRASVKAAARAASKLGIWRSAAASSSLWSPWRAAGSTRKRKPVRVPIGSSSTSTRSPSITTGSSAASGPMRFISTVVRRLTKRSVSRAWRASDRRASTARARSAISARAGTQSGRWVI